MMKLTKKKNDDEAHEEKYKAKESLTFKPKEQTKADYSDVRVSRIRII